MNTPLAKAMLRCDPKGPLMVHITKLYPSKDLTHFDAMGRIFSGRVQLGERVKVMGENYSLEDEEDMAIENITGLKVVNARYEIGFQYATAGNWIVIEGVDNIISKTATITTSAGNNDVYIFRPLR
jgi:U5 small nuclear ribonucleoprotein component